MNESGEEKEARLRGELRKELVAAKACRDEDMDAVVDAAFWVLVDHGRAEWEAGKRAGYSSARSRVMSKLFEG